MQNNDFFKRLWQFNALIIAVTGVMAVGVLAFASYKLFQETTRERTTRNIVSVAESAQAPKNWRIGAISKLNQQWVMLPLVSSQSFNRSYYAKAAKSIRNYLFIDNNTAQKHWLFEHNNYLIERADKLQTADYAATPAVLAILYQLVKQDTDQDQRLTARDLRTLALSDAKGIGYIELLDKVETVTDHQLISKDKLLIVYRKAGESYTAIINLVNRELIDNSRLPRVGENA